MSSETFDVPHLLSPRKQKHIVMRGVAEAIDLVLVSVALSLISTVVGETAIWVEFPVLLLYFVIMEAHSGQTIGKRVTNLRVVDSTGTAPSIGQSLIRNLIRPFEAFGLLGVILVAFTEKGQRLGDLLASTFVVHDDELQDLATTESNLAANQLPSSRDVIAITAKALELAKDQISAAYKPEETGLRIAVDDGRPHGLTVQFDIIDTSDDCWHWTTEGVTISVPRGIADRCEGFQIVAQDGKLVLDRAT